MKINELAELIDEYEQRIADAANSLWYEIIITHTLISKEDGDLTCWWVCNVSNKKDIAYASVTMTTHTRLAFIDWGNNDFIDE